MAIGVIFNGTGVTEAQYRQVLEQVNPDHQPAPGARYHAAGPSQDGFCVVEIWDSQEDVQRFFDEKLGAALQAAGISVQPVFFEIINTIEA